MTNDHVEHMRVFPFPQWEGRVAPPHSIQKPIKRNHLSTYARKSAGIEDNEALGHRQEEDANRERHRQRNLRTKDPSKKGGGGSSRS